MCVCVFVFPNKLYISDVIQVAVIRRAFAATFFQRRRRRSSSSNRTVHIEGQPSSFTQAVAGAVTNLVSPALVTRKAHAPSIKNFHLKSQEYSSSKAGKWLPGLWSPPPPSPSEAHIPRTHLVNTKVSRASDFGTAQMEHSPHDVMSATHLLEPHIQEHFGEESFAQFLMRSEDMEAANVCCLQEEEEEEEDGNNIPVEHKGTNETLDVRAKEMQEMWHRNQDDIFQKPPPTAKARSHKKLRNRKTHTKLLLVAPEVPLPQTSSNLTSQLTILSMDAGHSAAANNTTTSPPPSWNMSNKMEKSHYEMGPVPVVLTNEKRKETSRETHSTDNNYSDPECQGSRPAATACFLDSGETANIK